LGQGRCWAAEIYIWGRKIVGLLRYIFGEEQYWAAEMQFLGRNSVAPLRCIFGGGGFNGAD